LICSFNFPIFLAVCLNISAVINIKILTNSNQQTQSYKFTSHIAAFLSVVLITEMLEICIQTSYDQNVQLILKSFDIHYSGYIQTHCQKNRKIKRADQILPEVYGTTLNRFIILMSSTTNKWDKFREKCSSEITVWICERGNQTLQIEEQKM
jgi:hypothetical protein